MIILCTQDDTQDSQRNLGFLEHGRNEIFQMLELSHPSFSIDPVDLAKKAKSTLDQAAYGSHPDLEAGYVSGRLQRLIALCDLASSEGVLLQTKEIYV